MTAKPTNCRTKRRGSATVEFAVLLPILITIGLLCVDFGRFAHVYIAVTNAAGAGAALGSLTPVTPTSKPTWDADIRQVIEHELAGNAWFRAEDLVIPEPEVTDENNLMRLVRVEVQYPFQTLVTWSFLPGYNDPLILSRVVVMRTTR